MADLSLKHIYKVYPNGVKAVNDFSIEISDREFIVFVGPSGCGKSTTLRMIAGLEEITAGVLEIGGRMVNDAPAKERDIAMVFQNYALYPHMTVFENMAFPLKMKKLKKDEIRRKVESAAEILGLTDYLQKKPSDMSGGQRQRVALGRAIVREPKVFLLDEPLSNLDAKLRTQMRTEITKIHRRVQTTFIYVTHDQTEAMTMGDRIVVMKDGYIYQIDTPKNLYRYPSNKFVAGFIGTPAMNFFQATMEKEKGGGRLCFANGQEILLPYTCLKKLKKGYFYGKPMTLGIRPEDIRVSNEPKNGLSCIVHQTEDLGSEQMIYASFDLDDEFGYAESGNKVTVKYYGKLSPKKGDVLYLSFDETALHFFDAVTEECVSPRIPLYSILSGQASEGTLSYGKTFFPLSPALSDLDGGVDFRIPLDAVELSDKGIDAELEKAESLENGYLLQLSLEGQTIFCMSNTEPKNKRLSVQFSEERIDILRGESVLRNALPEENTLFGKLEKVVLSKEERKSDTVGFAIDAIIGETRFRCPKEMLIRLLAATDTKLFGREMEFRFTKETARLSEAGIPVVQKGVLDYGKKKYHVLLTGEQTVYCLAESENASNYLTLDMTQTSVIDRETGIRIA